ncbi:MAG TPA: glycoside hydrolase family 3 N-terminal domain-containing protein [Kofleriaceae bacterium]|nr:glycoside hydrolase family 3 N-terminal domain-containing protein [Kofleriaceae bacterium]
MTIRTARWRALGCAAVFAALTACASDESTTAPDDRSEADPDGDATALSAARDRGGHHGDDGGDGGGHGDECREITEAPQYDDWPAIESPLSMDEEQEEWIARVVAAMTLEQKIGQMTQLEVPSLWDPATSTYQVEQITQFHIGSVLTGGGSWPAFDKHAPVSAWVELADSVWDASPVIEVPAGDDCDAEEVRIPAFWGIDAVHGNANVFGATTFPHNIGLGATRDTCLVRDIGEATQRAVRAIGLDWTFSPCLAVVRDDRWGRTYESWSEDPSVVREFAAAMTEGIMGLGRDHGGGHGHDGHGDDGDTSFRGILSTAKHYIADGGSVQGIDQGIVQATEEELINIHGQGYYGALASGAQTIMIGFFGWQDRGEMAGDQYLVDEVIKNKMGYDGLIVSDWNAIGFVAGCTNDHCPQAVNAGIDLFMVPFEWQAFITNTIADVEAGLIPMSRIDDAVTRILRVKLRAGLFDMPRPSERRFAGEQDELMDRQLARRAVRKSLVLLKNDDNVLPLRRDEKILVVGKSADSIQNQTGGWTLSWQGGPAPFAPDAFNLNSDFPAGQSILAGIQEAVGAENVTFSEDASGVEVGDHDAVIAIIGEYPYAEVFGDVATADGNWRDPDNLARRTLEHGVRHPEDRAVLQAVSGQGVPVVTVLVAGRVLYTNAELNLSDAFVAAWLPGTEGGGVSDVLFRKRNGKVNHDFTGTLPFSWPRSACQTAVNVGDPTYDPQFAFGYGLTYPTEEAVGTLDETAGPAGGCTE